MVSDRNGKNGESRSKDKKVERVKLSKEAEKNIKEIITNKIPNDSKPKKYSGAKRMEMKSKEVKEEKKNFGLQIPVIQKEDLEKEYRSEVPSSKK